MAVQRECAVGTVLGFGNKVGSNKAAFLAPFSVVSDAGSVGFRIGVKVAL